MSDTPAKNERAFHARALAIALAALIAREAPLSVPSTAGGPPSGPFDSTRRQEIVSELERWAAASDPVGCELLVLEKGEVVLHEAAGWSDLERGAPWRKETICRLRSLTKPYIATLALQLATEGLLDLDAPLLGEHFPGASQGARRITPRQLLTQTSGYPQPGYPGEPAEYHSLQEIAAAIASQEPTFLPGTVFVYSDANTMLLGSLVETLRGKPLADVLEERILRPLGLEATLLSWSPDDPRASRLVPTYRLDESGPEKYWTPGQPLLVPWFRASGGLFASARDVATFLEAWSDPGDSRLGVSAELRMLARTPSAPSRQSAAFAYGMHWQIYETTQPPGFGHTGSDGTIAWADPLHDRVVVFFSQTRGTASIARVPNLIARLLDEGRGAPGQ